MTTPPQIPAHLNEDLILAALNPKGLNKVVIKSLNIERNMLGGNYCSDIYRAKIEYTTEDQAKTEVTNSVDDQNKVHTSHLLIKELFSSVSAASQEHFTYVSLLPLMEEVLAKADVKSPALSPKLYLAHKSEKELHIFDDMNTLGSKVCDRYEGFNLCESKMIVGKLANFHAASMIVMKKHPEVVAKLSGHIWLNNPDFKPFIQLIIDENIKHIIPIVEKWHGYEQIAEKLTKNTGDVFERKFYKLFEKSAAIQVITHGDLWINNILVKPGSKPNEVEDAVFLDYQNVFVGSPAFDLLNIFMTSLNFDVLTQHREFLILHYFERLCKVLKQCKAADYGIELPTFQDLKAEIARLEYFTFYVLIFAFPQTNLAEELAQDMDYGGFFEPKRLARNRLNMFANARVLATLKHVLKRLDDAGVLDC